MSKVVIRSTSPRDGQKTLQPVRKIVLTYCILLLLAGCRLGSSPYNTPPLHEPPPSLTPSPVPTVTPSATMTPTPHPSDTPTPSPTPPPLRIEVTLDDTQVLQGHTTVVWVTGDRPVTVTGAVGEDRPLHFVRPASNTHYVSFLGIRATDEPGRLPVVVVVRSDDGQQVEITTMLTVLDAHYPQEAIHLSSEVSQLLDPAITQPELLRLAQIYSLATSTIHWEGRFDWPFQGTITSRFGTRRQYNTGLRSYHTGLDIDGITGDVITAPAKGIVVLADQLKVRGGAVILDHGAGVLSGYYHLDSIDVEVGQTVERGQQLGQMGATGLVTGSHLHWELRVNGVAVDPLEWTERDFFKADS